VGLGRPKGGVSRDAILSAEILKPDDSVVDRFGRVVVEQSENPGEKLFERELVRNDNAGVFPAIRRPIPRKPVEVRDVVCQECPMLLSGEDELVGIGGRDAASVLRCEDVMAWREPWGERHLRG
jgi:hypothetical protein